MAKEIIRSDLAVMQIHDTSHSDYEDQFITLNQNKVEFGTIYKDSEEFNVLITDSDPQEVLCPEKWYYFNGVFMQNDDEGRVKTFLFAAKSDGDYWVDYSKPNKD